MEQILTEINEKEIKQLHRDIGLLVKRLREEKEISQLQIALSIGIKSVAFYSNCENSKNNKHFNVEHVYKICKILNIKPSDFFHQIENL